MATKSSTIYYSSKYPDLQYKKLGKTGFTASICGFGSYRVDDSIIEHHHALEYALRHGINLIDTSSNYSLGGSERLIGNVLQKLLSEDRITLEDIIVITKGGYIQGDNLAIAIKRETAGNPYPEIVKCNPELWHCIHPVFLEDQLQKSLKYLQLKKVDVYLLHNPEYFLTYSKITSYEEMKNEYYRRIRQAFEYLEREVKNGRISYYGISSNTFVETEDKNNFTSLERIYNMATEISNNNHFAVIQFPLNLIERGAVSIKNQLGNSKSLLEFAKEKDLGVLINRPLNSIMNNKIVRLTDFNTKENRNREEINELISKLCSLEKEMIDTYVNKMNKSYNDKKNLLGCLSLGKLLESKYDKFESPNQFIDMKGSYLIPRANFVVDTFGNYFEDDDKIINLLNNYAVLVNITLDSIESNLARQWNEKNIPMHSNLNKYLDSKQQNLTLSQKAIMFVNALDEISSTLVGMRKVEYVKNILGCMTIHSNSNLNKYW